MPIVDAITLVVDVEVLQLRRIVAVCVLSAFGVADELTLGVVIVEVQTAAFGGLDRMDGTGGGVPAPRSPQSKMLCGCWMRLHSFVKMSVFIEIPNY